MFNLIGAIISGLVIGALARYFYPGAVPMGWLTTILLGVGGSLLAGLVGGGYRGARLNRGGCLASILGAMALIFLGRVLGSALTQAAQGTSTVSLAFAALRG